MKEFADMLLDIYHRRNRDPGRIREVSDSILEQVMDNNANLSGQE
jgi:hypothetical protein